MGNCLVSSNSKVSSAQVHENHEFDSKRAQELQHTAVTPMPSNKKKKKTVRFNLQEDGDHDQDDGGRVTKNNTHTDDSKSGVVRIRLVVTQEELKQLLNYKNDSISNGSSLEQLLSSIKSRSGSCRVSAGSSEETWRPVLESIPEDQN